ncbi:MAG: hypothetical protein HC828_22535, partial [Blastochloris sp.]|nr:hypothetical protein [Blastochloris sp.]
MTRLFLDGGGGPGVRVFRDGHVDLEAEAAKGIAPGKNSVYSQGSISNTETAAWHRSARIALNAHRRMTTVETL